MSHCVWLVGLGKRARGGGFGFAVAFGSGLRALLQLWPWPWQLLDRFGSLAALFVVWLVRVAWVGTEVLDLYDVRFKLVRKLLVRGRCFPVAAELLCDGHTCPPRLVAQLHHRPLILRVAHECIHGSFDFAHFIGALRCGCGALAFGRALCICLGIFRRHLALRTTRGR